MVPAVHDFKGGALLPFPIPLPIPLPIGQRPSVSFRPSERSERAEESMEWVSALQIFHRFLDSLRSLGMTPRAGGRLTASPEGATDD